MIQVTTMNASALSGRDSDTVDLASLVAARLCHDLVSPLGAIGNGIELLEMSGDYAAMAKSPELTLISESVSAARARLRFYRTAFGHAPEDQRMSLGDVASLVQEFAAGSRLSVDIDGQGDLSRVEGRMLLLSLMCLDSAMPWGGRVLGCRTEHGWRVVGDASRMRIERVWWEWLDGAAAAPRPMPAPAEVQFPLLAALARQGDRRLSWELDETGAEISF